jgi:seryl-tRNA synthetase
MANLKQIYDEAVQHNHESALAAIESVVRAEVNAARDEAEKLLTGVDVKAILAESEALKAQVADLTRKLTAAEDQASILQNKLADATPEVPVPTAALSAEPNPTVPSVTDLGSV